VSQIEADLKTKAQAYNALKTSLQTMEKKQTGSLMTRHLVRSRLRDHPKSLQLDEISY
jgi:V-type H+-transporting ATPase subunit C